MAAQIIKISVKAQVKQMTRDLTKVQKKIVPRITSQALNFTARKYKTQLVKQTAAAVKIKQKLIRARVRFSKQAKPQDLRVIISVWFMNVWAIALGSKGTKVDVPTFSKKFVATMKTGHTGVFARKSVTRLPIKEVSVPINPVGEGIAVRLIDSFAIPAFLKEWQRLLAMRLKRKG